MCSIITEALHSACKSSAYRTTNSNAQTRTADQRWKTLVELGDPKKIWKAIDWNGMLTKQPLDKDRPSDETFIEYFTHLLNLTYTDELIIPHVATYCPVLDDPINEMEVDREIKGLNAGKATGVNVIPPGIFKFLPVTCICFITLLLNLVFMCAYPGAWCLAKVFTIFKKGVHSLSSNYRGISIL